MIAGQGTTGLEIARQAQKMGVNSADVLVCCGGGGLTSGIALALDGYAPGLRPRPCEPEGFDDVKRSLASGRIQSNAAAAGNICDAILTPQPGEITFPILKPPVRSRDFCVGTRGAAGNGAGLSAPEKSYWNLAGQSHWLRPCFRKDEIEGDAVIVVASGGNVDPAIFAQALEFLT